MSGDRPFFVHAGLPKTGTTLLQKHLFAKHSQLDYLGIFKDRAAPTPFDQCRDPQVGELFRDLIKSPKSANIDQNRAIYEDEIRPTLRGGRTFLWSLETLSYCQSKARQQRARNLKGVFGNCRVVMAVRHPVQLLESDYIRALIGFTLRATPDNVCAAQAECSSFWQRMMHRWIKRGIVEQDINTWLAARWKQVAVRLYLDYAQSVKDFSDVLGRDSVHVVVYEDLLNQPQDFIRTVCGHLDIDGEEGVGLVTDQKENVRWGAEPINRLQEIMRSPKRVDAFLHAPLPERYQMIGLDPDGNARRNGQPAKCPMSSEWKRRVEEHTRDGNRFLVNEWKLPLAQYEYPL